MTFYGTLSHLQPSQPVGKNWYWWGDDPDGEIVGYKYKRSSDTAWTFTDLESGIFYVPYDQSLTSFHLRFGQSIMMGMRSNTFTINPSYKNSPPELSFRHHQILITNRRHQLHFPKRTFIWDLFDQDGNETITDVFYSIDDTCETCWVSLDGDETSITLSDMDPVHTFL